MLGFDEWAGGGGRRGEPPSDWTTGSARSRGHPWASKEQGIAVGPWFGIPVAQPQARFANFIIETAPSPELLKPGFWEDAFRLALPCIACLALPLLSLITTCPILSHPHPPSQPASGPDRHSTGSRHRPLHCRRVAAEHHRHRPVSIHPHPFFLRRLTPPRRRWLAWHWVPANEQQQKTQASVHRHLGQLTPRPSPFFRVQPWGA